jgi:NAD(P)-dependent dehydrogenase (short-subunit alcohol dehydrogenase family)
MPEAVAVIIGAGGGIGAACAKALARSRIVICADPAAARAAATAEAVRQAGGRAEAVTADAGDPGFAADLVTMAARTGPVVAAVHAVAHEEHASADDLTADSVLRSLAVGPVAAFSLFRELMTRHALGPDAALTVIGSLHADYPFRQCLGYNAAHGALAQVVRTLAHEWAGRGVRINAVVPGWIRTPGEVAHYGESALDAAAAALPFGRFGTAAEVAAAVNFLSSAQASYISGAFLTVDGALAVSLARLPGGAGGAGT